MMRFPSLKVPIFLNKTPQNIKFSLEALEACVRALCAINCVWLKNYPNTPRIYDAGVRYVPENNAEDWQTIPYVIQAKEGDCEDLATWRAAELQIRDGINAIPFVKTRKLPNGNFRAHVMVRLPDGTIEDPSARLGMLALGRRD